MVRDHGGRSVKAVLFDVDGTLIDSNDFHAQAWHDAMVRFGADLTLADVRAQIGKGADNLMPALLDADFIAVHGEAVQDYRSALFARAYLDRIKPFADVRPLFERVVGSGLRIALASSGATDEVAHHLDLIGCADLVAATTSIDDVEHSKPDPDIFVAAVGKLGVPAEEAVIVGDSPYDMQAAKAIGLRTIGVRCGGFADAALREAGADALFDDPADLLARFDVSVLAVPQPA